MNYLNRSLVAIYAKRELLDWVKTVKPNLFRWSLEMINDDPCGYLINIEDQNCKGGFLEAHYREIVENELGRLYIEKEHWPENIDLELFNNWFSYTYHTEVYDLVSEEDVK